MTRTTSVIKNISFTTQIQTKFGSTVNSSMKTEFTRQH